MICEHGMGAQSALLQGRGLSSSETLWLLNHGQIAQWHASEPFFLLLLFPVRAALGTRLSYFPQGLHSLSWPLGLLGRGTEGQAGCSHLWAPEPASLCISLPTVVSHGQSHFNKLCFCARTLSWEADGAACCQDCPRPSFATLMV